MQRHSKTLTNHKTLMMFFAISSSLVLSSCTTLITLDKLTDSPSHSKTLISDALIAYGYAKTPIPQHEDALIIVGQKYNYLVETDQDESNHKILKDTVSQLDLKALSIMPEQVQRPGYFEIYQDDQKEVFRAKLKIKFSKTLSQISSKEQQSLKQLNFNCSTNSTQQSYDCSRIVGYTLSPFKKANQDSQLQHTFKSPIALELKVSKKRPAALNAISKAPYALLLPITVVVDIVTLPIQFIVITNALTEKRH